jgi:hypothetical protein
MKDDTKTQKAIWNKILAVFIGLHFVVTLPALWFWLALMLTRSIYATGLLVSVSVACYYLALYAVYKLVIEDNIGRLRKYSPRANFITIMDTDEEIQRIKQQAHCANSPAEFEDHMMQICSRFYDEGYCVGVIHREQNSGK